MVTFRGDDPLKLKCTQIDFGWGSAPDPNGGAYGAPQTPSWIKGDLLLKGGEGKGGKEKKKKGEDKRDCPPPSKIPNTLLGPRPPTS